MVIQEGGLYLAWWFIPVIVWMIIWKLMAMWRAARNNQIFWFIACLVINTVGVLPMLYLIFFQKDMNHLRKAKKIEVKKVVGKKIKKK
ncbi:MAG: DUF5652 family protein [archaeon]|nr:DUF5652 family protein [archaeon]MCR4323850.1 DUF5652 family protein [Nanoarchaeota archaeon]